MTFWCRSGDRSAGARLAVWPRPSARSCGAPRPTRRSRTSRSRASRSRLRSRAGSGGSRLRRRARTPTSGSSTRRRPRGSRPPERIAAGELDDQFPIDVFQTGSGTSSNMNANEVMRLARRRGRAPERRRQPGPVLERRLPVRRAPGCAGRDRRRPAARARAARQRRWRRKAKEFDDVVKSGRTHLMDADAGDAGPGVRRVRRAGAPGHRAASQDALPRLGRIPLGGTADGHRHQHPPEFAARVRSPAPRGDRVSTSRRRPTTSRPRPRATAWSKPRAPSRSSPSR